ETGGVGGGRGERGAGGCGGGASEERGCEGSGALGGAAGRGAGGGGVSGQADVRLGQQLQAIAAVRQPVGDGRAVMLRAATEFARSPFDLFEDGHRVAQARVDLGAVGLSVARSLGTAVDLSARVKTEYAHWVEDVSAVATPDVDRLFYTVGGIGQLDTYDRGVFPRSGVALRA